MHRQTGSTGPAQHRGIPRTRTLTAFLNETKIKSAELNHLPPPMGRTIFWFSCWTCVCVFSGLWDQAGSPPAGCAELRHAGHSGIRHHQGKKMITYSLSVCCAEGYSLKQKRIGVQSWQPFQSWSGLYRSGLYRSGLYWLASNCRRLDFKTLTFDSKSTFEEWATFFPEVCIHSFLSQCFCTVADED